MTDRGALARHCARLGIEAPPAVLGDDAAAFVVSAVAGDPALDDVGKRRLAAAYLASRGREPVNWSDVPGWAAASGWYDKADAVLRVLQA